MRFWDSSAVIPLVIDQMASDLVRAEYVRDPEQLVWWACEVECASALSRLEREGKLDASALKEALRRLSEMTASWRQVEPIARIRQSAIRLVRVHPIKAADALQLAAALAASEGQPASLAFVTLDERLALAAEREGFPVILAGLKA